MAGRRRRLDSDHPRRAWLVRSLRRPEEVQFLRHRGAKRLGDRERLEPRVVRDYDTWSAGGPALQADYIAEIECEAVQAFVVDMQERGLTLPET